MRTPRRTMTVLTLLRLGALPPDASDPGGVPSASGTRHMPPRRSRTRGGDALIPGAPAPAGVRVASARM